MMGTVVISKLLRASPVFSSVDRCDLRGYYKMPGLSPMEISNG